MPNDARAHAAQGLIALERGDLDFADSEIELAVKLNGKDPDVNSIAYQFYRKSINPKMAMSTLIAGFELDQQTYLHCEIAPIFLE